MIKVNTSKHCESFFGDVQFDMYSIAPVININNREKQPLFVVLLVYLDEAVNNHFKIYSVRFSCGLLLDI